MLLERRWGNDQLLQPLRALLQQRLEARVVAEGVPYEAFEYIDGSSRLNPGKRLALYDADGGQVKVW